MRSEPLAHWSMPWRIHEIAPDFELVDVWALPTPGERADFPRLVRLAASMDPEASSSPVVRALFAVRRHLGTIFRLDDPSTGLGARVASLRERLPGDLSGALPDEAFGGAPFEPLYVTEDEFAAEIANRTVHGVLHLGWVPDEEGGYRGQLAILVKTNGLLGRAYLAAIAPFRHAVVYPRLMREFGDAWRAENADRAGT